jgi:hypothetical protein
VDFEKELNQWMDEHQTDFFDLIREAMSEFESAHPGTDQEMVRLNALSMADRRFMARALGAMLPKYLEQAVS